MPGGFGERGVEGMVAAARYARENNVPYFGICLGMQVAVIEFARDCAGLTDAHSREFAPACENAVIDLMPDQRGVVPKGGTMRLGGYPCELQEGTRPARDSMACLPSRSVTATAMKSTTSTVKRWRLPASRSAACRRITVWWRRWNWRIILSLSVCSTIRSSSPARTARIPIFRAFVEASWQRKK